VALLNGSEGFGGEPRQLLLIPLMRLSPSRLHEGYWLLTRKSSPASAAVEALMLLRAGFGEFGLWGNLPGNAPAGLSLQWQPNWQSSGVLLEAPRPPCCRNSEVGARRQGS
jgi:hypothetical protein